jgi:Ca-activated chloride channel family protein
MLSTGERQHILNVGGILLFLFLMPIASGQKPQTWEALSSKPSFAPAAPGNIRVPAQPDQSLFKGKQGLQQTEIHFDPTTGIVTLKLLVQDPNGYFVPNIRRDNFVVYENGVRQSNATVEIEHAPISLGLLMEFGGRYQRLRKALGQEVSNAGHELLDVLGRDDKIAIWKYGDSVEAVVKFSPAQETLNDAFYTPRTPEFSESNLYDALISTLKSMRPVSGRKALILISSGVDTFSKAKYEDVLNSARESGTPIYVIGLSPVLRKLTELSEPPGPLARIAWEQADQHLMEIARVSGGRAYFPESTVDLSPTYDDIMENLRIRYVITYKSSSDATSSLPRTVRVELVNPKTGGPLEIVDSNGKTIRANVIAQDSYTPVLSGQ